MSPSGGNSFLDAFGAVALNHIGGKIVIAVALGIQETGRGALWLSDGVLDSRSRGCRFEPRRRHSLVSLSKTHYPLLVVLVQPRKTVDQS